MTAVLERAGAMAVVEPLDGPALWMIIEDRGPGAIPRSSAQRCADPSALTLHDLAVALVRAEQEQDAIGVETCGELLYRFRRVPELLATWYVCAYCGAIGPRRRWTQQICTDCARRAWPAIRDLARYWCEVDAAAALAALPRWLPITREAA